MSDDHNSTLTPHEGVAAIMALVPQIAEKAANNDLSGINDLLDQLEMIATSTGLDMSAITAQFSGLREQSAHAQHHFANHDAAMWAGDMARARFLNDRGPSIDHAALGVPDFSDDVGWDEDAARDEVFDQRGIDPYQSLQGAEIPADRYGDIALGKSGAIAAFIATGLDPNTPTGDSLHTAFLAALDAPHRNLGDLQALCDAGADPCLIHAWGDNSLSWAMGYPHLDTVTAQSEMAIISFLCKRGVDVNHGIADFGSVFRRALINGGVDQVAALLANGADPTGNLPDDFPSDFLAGATPIMAAAPKPDVIALLLSHGIDPHTPDSKGRDPIAFIAAHARAARERVSASDPWTGAFADALETTLALLPGH